MWAGLMYMRGILFPVRSSAHVWANDSLSRGSAQDLWSRVGGITPILSRAEAIVAKLCEAHVNDHSPICVTSWTFAWPLGVQHLFTTYSQRVNLKALKHYKSVSCSQRCLFHDRFPYFVLSQCSFHWCEVGGAQIEKGEVWLCCKHYQSN